MAAESSSGLVRTIGRWSLAALIVNSVIGGGVFGLPSVVAGRLGKYAPLAYLVAAAGIALVAACLSEVASQFSETGGPYLYARTALGKILGNSNRVDDVVISTRGGVRHGQSFCHLSCGVHPARSAARLSSDDTGRVNRSAGGNQLSRSTISDTGQRFSNQHKNISFADLYWRGTWVVDRTRKVVPAPMTHTGYLSRLAWRYSGAGLCLRRI